MMLPLIGTEFVVSGDCILPCPFFPASSIIRAMADQANKNREQSGVAESPIAEVFEGRHPLESEKRWAEGTLAKTLEKAREKAIGDPTGVNVDEHGHARFTTISNEPIRRL